MHLVQKSWLAESSICHRLVGALDQNHVSRHTTGLKQHIPEPFKLKKLNERFNRTNNHCSSVKKTTTLDYVEIIVLIWNIEINTESWVKGAEREEELCGDPCSNDLELFSSLNWRALWYSLRLLIIIKYCNSLQCVCVCVWLLSCFCSALSLFWRYDISLDLSHPSSACR